MNTKNSHPLSLRIAPAKAGFALAGLMAALPVQAIEFDFADGEVTGSVDTTVAYGALWRVESRKTNIDNGGVNDNDGNRNFDTGLVSSVYKINTEVEMNYLDYGAFVRARGYYDAEIMDKKNDSGDLPYQPSGYGRKYSDKAKDYAGSRAEFMDAFVYGNFYLGENEMPLSLRLGKQVISWGEGIFYREGVNSINALDAAAFNLPGSEVKDALLPAGMLYANLGITDNLSAEAFVQWEWNETRLNPVGTYFSTTDLFSPGGEGNLIWQDVAGTPLEGLFGAYLGGASAAVDPFVSSGSLNIDANTLNNGAWANFGQIVNDDEAKDSGQFGVALRYIAEELNETEFGFYYLNYHHKTPLISANLGDYSGTNFIGICSALQGGACVVNLANPAFQGAVGFGTLDVMQSVRAFRSYEENIDLWGASFTTLVGDTSVSGDIAYRPNNPIFAYHEDDLLGSVVRNAPSFFGGTNADCADLNVPHGATGQKQNLLDSVCVGETVHNWVETQTVNWNLNAIHNFGPVLSFDRLIGVVEVSGEWLPELTSNEMKVMNSTAQNSGDNSVKSKRLTRTAYGATAVLQGRWNDVIAGVNLSPVLVVKSDIDGNSHRAGNFMEGRSAYSLGLNADYLSTLSGGISYTQYEGAGSSNNNTDRDHVAFNIKYSF
ncbi:DUF1302 domain-containing protein [Aestuariirhabdus litorea]|uniref:DUF1302 domain-containing protein n=1 Tax=Aestuariirhabdus litorea TaxID=2528527 RepID=A0A3P3VQG5_9GAMM|nr:DUF1302 domain-containing protein [Aestuariirhabdus litorea]RRJ84860.1 DUF1302 domain-containing protein [Aestuariirhabdus litorea]RWW98086.1 DUF1302 family protein [Endozoicomonadaceae bacterium GTF-13]